jgi:alpha-beta hydrolase superfamily lysophospholipase
MRLRRTARWAFTALLAGLVLLNLAAYRQAWAFTHFGPPGEKRSGHLSSLREKAEALLLGVDVPRPVNRQSPGDVGLAYERQVFAGGRGVALEAWRVPRAEPRGTVVLFHGHAASKDSQLREARAFHDMGFQAILVDFYGSGGSAGNETSIGFYEALDVTRAYEYARQLPDSGPVVLYGASMGAAAILKGVADDGLRPEALVLECPFSGLLETVRHRFTGRGLPSFPLAELLVFWGGVQEGFDALRFRPVESASRVDRPTLVLNGDADPWVRPEEAKAVAAALQGPKSLQFFAGVGHDAGIRHRPEQWIRAVGEFLERFVGPGRGERLTPASTALVSRSGS